MITASAECTASTTQLWGVLGDLERWGDLLPTFLWVRHLGQGPVGVGSRFRVRQPGLPAAVYAITAWEPGQGFAWASRAPGVQSRATHTIVPTGPGCRLDLSFDWVGPLAPAVRALAGSKGAAMVQSEVETLTRLAEQQSGAGEPG